MVDENGICRSDGCERPARCAIRTVRSADRVTMKTIVHYDERSAPKTAVPYCKKCATEILVGLVEVLVYGS